MTGFTPASLWRAVILGLIPLALSACDKVPGTDAYKIAQAKEIVSKDLIDPSSPMFRNLSVHSDVVCGEINGKNRMGAYTGFARFFVRMTGESALIDPQFDVGDLLSAQDLCSSMRTNMYSSYASTRSACERASDEELKQTVQSLFDTTWRSDCEGQTSAPPQVQSQTGNESAAGSSESSSTEMAASADEPNEEAIEEEPVEDIGDPPTEASANPEASAELNESWLDDVLGGNRSRSVPQPTNRSEEPGLLVDEYGNPIDENSVAPEN